MDAKRPMSISFKGYRPASDKASRTKSANRKTDALHERLLGRELRRLGLRFRKNDPLLVGVPDIVFPKTQVAVFCDGDFWHGRSWRRLRQALAKRHNPDYWIAKIKRNRARDRSVTRQLTTSGWLVVRFWETDILSDPAGMAAKLESVVRRR